MKALASTGKAAKTLKSTPRADGTIGLPFADLAAS
jgi:hypothetical protein